MSYADDRWMNDLNPPSLPEWKGTLYHPYEVDVDIVIYRGSRAEVEEYADELGLKIHSLVEAT